MFCIILSRCSVCMMILFWVIILRVLLAAWFVISTNCAILLSLYDSPEVCICVTPSQLVSIRLFVIYVIIGSGRCVIICIARSLMFLNDCIAPWFDDCSSYYFSSISIYCYCNCCISCCLLYSSYSSLCFVSISVCCFGY